MLFGNKYQRHLFCLENIWSLLIKLDTYYVNGYNRQQRVLQLFEIKLLDNRNINQLYRPESESVH